MIFKRTIISICILVFASGSDAQCAIIEGIILSPEGAANKGSVSAFSSFESLQQNEPAFQSEPGEKPGEFKMEMPAGRYYFTAQGSNSDHEKLYSYHGLNPIIIKEGHKWIPFFAVPVTQKICVDGFQGIGGSIAYHDQPLKNGSVSVYSVEDEPFRGMGLLTNTLDDKGKFWFDLEPGHYMVIGRQRQSADTIGPLRSGDLFCYSTANPINLHPAESCDIALSCYPRNDINSFLLKESADPRGEKETKRRHYSLEGVTIEQRRTAESSQASLAIIAGRITDTDNLPISGLQVSAFPANDLKLFQMYIVRFKSGFMARSNSDGRFRLEVQAGSYYLVAREKIGEAPISGEYYGLYEGNSNHSITINPGETKTGIQILASPIMP